eukprot:Plantae.Rhodophyta-Purpureofilum_apyrenoidigerum.ctg7437.p1 GENE.Plantae.Rhodophyta-Purpureofilum_apyrenoidigerum.ctg7437~~Plantae.Rhodophyta-Purpureofilum_apyrenoidigerum.ctg7437.p1  ORF type:complete len:496 (-),score=111.59 Plantae.Rhodophyta-Purpureofilum_apyrenoidigerum.ctg7437:85-1572(-)
MDRKNSLADFVSPIVQTTTEHEEWRTLLARQPVILSETVAVQFKKQFSSTAWQNLDLELRATTLVFRDPGAKSKRNELYAFPLEFAKITSNEDKCLITCTYCDNMSISFKTNRTVYKSWRESVLSAAELQSVGLKDFTMHYLIGKGATGDVYSATEKLTGQKVAVKIMKKTRIAESDKALRRLVNERLILELLQGFPFSLQLHSAFQTEENLYIVTDFCKGGDLERYLKRRNNRLEMWQVKKIAAEITVALEFLHKHNIVYRDLKLENVLLDDFGSVRLADFGLSKLLRGENSSLSQSFCGTLGYIAPEMVEGQVYGMEIDHWALGCVLFKLLTGRTPYYAKSKESYFRAVSSGRVLFPEEVPEDARDLISSLMNVDPTLRPQWDEIKAHPFFADVDWNLVTRGEFMEDRSMFMRTESVKMTDDSLLTLPKQKSAGAKKENNWWDNGLPRVMSAILLGEKKHQKYVTIPGFLYSMTSNETLSPQQSLGSVTSLIS